MFAHGIRTFFYVATQMYFVKMSKRNLIKLYNITIGLTITFIRTLFDVLHGKKGSRRIWWQTLRKHAYSKLLIISPAKKENFQIKNSDIFHISSQNINCGYSIYVLSRNKKNNVYPCEPQFYYVTMRFKGVKIIKACFRDECLLLFLLC